MLFHFNFRSGKERIQMNKWAKRKFFCKMFSFNLFTFYSYCSHVPCCSLVPDCTSHPPPKLLLVLRKGMPFSPIIWSWPIKSHLDCMCIRFLCGLVRLFLQGEVINEWDPESMSEAAIFPILWHSQGNCAAYLHLRRRSRSLHFIVFGWCISLCSSALPRFAGAIGLLVDLLFPPPPFMPQLY